MIDLHLRCLRLNKKTRGYKRVCVNKKVKVIRLEMQFFLLLLLLVVFHSLCFGYCSNLFGFNLYYTDTELNNDDHHCLYYFVPEINLAYQFIEYCIRFSHNEEVLNYTDNDNSFTFEDLYGKNITSQQLYEWSAPIDLIESYQDYLENNISTNKLRFYNCTYPWFGSRCEYRFYKPLSSVSEQIEELYFNRFYYIWMSSPTLSCYIYLQCNRAGDRGESGDVCLDWREVCDGKIDCIDGGHDEDLCWLLEINDCDDKTEYRCQNGLCIPLAFLQDDEMNSDCLDRTDEPQIIRPTIAPGKINTDDFSSSCYLDPAFRCEESMCHPSKDRICQIACGDGSCVNSTDECSNKRNSKLLDARWFGVNISNECRHSIGCFTKLRGADFLMNNCPNLDGYYVKRIEQYCPKLIELPPILFGHVRFIYTNNQSQVSQYLITTVLFTLQE